MDKNQLVTIVTQKDAGRCIEAVRSDGLTVFLDKDDSLISQALNAVRLHGTKDQVIKAVGLVRGFQISVNYAQKQGIAPEDLGLDSGVLVAKLKSIKLLC